MSQPTDTPAAPLPITVAGGGLAGCMIALLLAQQGESVRLIEARPDFRAQQHTVNYLDSSSTHLGHSTHALRRSINLALSFRGLQALEAAGLIDSVKTSLIAMKGRAIHDRDGHIVIQAYGTRAEESIYSVSRTNLNRVLLDAIDELNTQSSASGRVELLFNHQLKTVDRDATVTVSTKQGEISKLASRFVVACDGAYSVVRDCLRRFKRVNFEQAYINHSYKELTIQPVIDSAGRKQYAFANHVENLHIWPRGDFMLIALPNPDYSYTVTLFAPHQQFDSLQSEEQVEAYFARYFSDVRSLMPTLWSDWQSSSVSSLVTIKCSTYNYNDKLVLLGDAAHAVVPFYGQGMNAAFEDCLIFSSLYREWKTSGISEFDLLERFSQRRVKSGLALADLSFNNYLEMRSHTASRLFLTRKHLESLLHKLMPSVWIPQYTMVAFTRMPYEEALCRSRRQEKILIFTLTATTLATITLTATALFRHFNQQVNTANINTLSPATPVINFDAIKR